MISILDTNGLGTAKSQLQEFTECIFGESGQLQSTLGLEHRPEQSSMANAVAEMLSENEALLAEAGTGVGKSLAYLIPGIMKAVDEQRPLIVSTHTKSLQAQIEGKDLELCRQLFIRVPDLQKYAAFNSVLLVGRGNYLCTTRLKQAIQRTAELFPTLEQQELARVAEWAQTTETGLIEELTPAPSPMVWDWVNAEATTCSKKNCSPNTCFFQKTRAELKEAHVVIVNHSLLFSLINAGVTPMQDVSGVLFPEDFIVLDEAHTVPDIATEHFGLRISSAGIDIALKMLFNPKRQKGLLTHHGHPSDYQLITETIALSEMFFASIKDQYLQNKDIVRLHEADWTEPSLIHQLKKITDRLAYLAVEAKSESARDELQHQRSRILSYANGIQRAITLEAEDHVHWLETSGRFKSNTVIRSAPIDVAPYLEEALFKRHTSVVMTSATLAAGRGMQAFSKKVGAGKAKQLIESSPFDYEKNLTTYVATDSPLPSKEQARLNADYLDDMILFASEAVAGGSLVLFTSYYDMRQVAERLQPKIKRPLWVQGDGYSRSELSDMLQKSGNGVLFGTDSFWTGVDIPGPALSQVIITRLPFQNPSHPIKQAQAEWLESQGRNPFAEITLAQALIQFRQGIGRLIRRGDDSGIITILDSRILYKPYGRQFLATLPKQAYLKFNKHNREAIFLGHPA